VTTARSRGRVALAHAAYDALFLLATVLATPPFLVRACRDRRQLHLARERLGWLPSGVPTDRPVWIHAVSVGEVKAARPLVRALRAHDPNLPLSLSTSTPAGYETARRAFPDLYVFHAPLDLGFVVRRVLRRLRPRLLVLLELEVWPALLRAADEAGVPQAIVNGRVTERSWRGYRRWGWWLPEFDRLALVAAQDETYGRRIADLGVPGARIRVTGNLKHELVEPPTTEAVAALARRAGLDDGAPVFVAGSTHAGEDELALAAWTAAGGARAGHFVLAPRHRERVPEILRLLKRTGQPCVLHSRGERRADPGTVLLIDTMGELEALFALASVVFLGGSLVPVGGHNVLEPAAAGCALLVGPHLESCRAEADLLARAGGLEIVADGAALATRLAALLADTEARQAMGRRARAAVTGLRGAAEADVRLLSEAGLLAAPRA
jgi:3-deoxy-D-manno-octulosonic-acid transferase